ncbi:hypothetical protein [Streptomyces telluris]|uniref:Uncharacterized protein n=1 Tax=Streptomyces telluris TaxID=2720021 RepID=A0A9X2RLX1_9ACTN|nr:hypothetical protein [Streptomyces telluris]MCQ8768510.1 hypothetical protein [Streptomyces telluris]NJP77008.1 hypothetical protein [Streptomyces telluris]
MVDTARGCVLLLDGTPDRRRGVLPNPTAHAIAGANPRRFLAADAVDVVQLPAVEGPQSALAYLQHAAAVPGPLLVWVTGRLMIPARRGGELHLALPGSTPATVRYTGLPWAWLLRTLQAHAGPVLVLADLEADPAALPHVESGAQTGELSQGVPLFGVVQPVPPVAAREAGPYTRALLEALQTGDRRAGAVLDASALHQRALLGAGLGAETLPLQWGVPGPVLANVAAGTRPHPRPRYAAAPAPAPVLPHPAPVQRPEPPAAPVAPAPAEEQAPSQDDLLPVILAAAHAGRHNEAAAMAAAGEQQALRRHGPDSPEAGLWVEVRADLARMAGDHARAAELWMAAAGARLGRSGPADEEALAAVKRAHYCWQHSGDGAVRLAPTLLALWERIPGGEGAAEHIRAYLQEAEESWPGVAR